MTPARLSAESQDLIARLRAAAAKYWGIKPLAALLKEAADALESRK